MELATLLLAMLAVMPASFRKRLLGELACFAMMVGPL